MVGGQNYFIYFTKYNKTAATHKVGFSGDNKMSISRKAIGYGVTVSRKCHIESTYVYPLAKS